MPKYTQSNKQVEATNKTLLNSLKKMTQMSKRKIGRRVIWCLIGLLDNQQKTH